MGTKQVSPTPSSNDYMLHPKNHLSIGDMCLSPKHIESCKDHEDKFTVVGKVISSQSLSKHSVKRVLLRAWPLKGRWDIDDIASSEHNMFRFVFQSLDDRQWVIDKGPCSVNGEILILRDWDPSVSIQSISFKFSLWWVQIHGIPPAFMTRHNLWKIGEKVGTVIDMELNESSRWKPSVRVQLSINVNNPLYPGFYMPMESQKPTWVQLKYEKFLYFCFRCGRLGHEKEACSEEADTTIASLQGSIVPLFGPRLRVDSKLPDCFIAAIQRAEREVKRVAKRSPYIEAVVQPVEQPTQGEVSGDIVIENSVPSNLASQTSIPNKHALASLMSDTVSRLVSTSQQDSNLHSHSKHNLQVAGNDSRKKLANMPNMATSSKAQAGRSERALKVPNLRKATLRLVLLFLLQCLWTLQNGLLCRALPLVFVV